jgi:alkaline phosphatase
MFDLSSSGNNINIISSSRICCRCLLTCRSINSNYLEMVRKIHYLFAILCLYTGYSTAQTYKYEPYRQPIRPTKNVIVMIPDGTSIGVVSAARWYKIYNKMGRNLSIDPYLCGTVKTYSSNAPIGDSAPTTSSYMTGMPAQTGNVAIYPKSDPANDLVDVNNEMAYQPLATILEAARIEQGKSIGLVVTCEFPHATPADCSAHHYRRGNYSAIGSQMANQNLDVMFGGGNAYVTQEMNRHFSEKNIRYIKNNIQAFRNVSSGKTWALFADKELPYDLDRNTDSIPSLQEMTEKAISLLSQNQNGFFLMVEGSKVDWTAHANDAVGCITEYIAFDNAVAAALDFAKKDGNTTVIILPDHGNSGFTIGRRDLKSYDKATFNDLFANVSKYKKTAEGLEEILLKEKPENFKSVIKKYTEIDISDDELKSLLNSKNYQAENYMKVGESQNMNSTLVNIMNKRTYFGFTSGGHTGEEVFLAAYHPQGDIPLGMNTNIEINRYLSDVIGLQTKLPQLTGQIFAKHNQVFSGLQYSIDKKNPDFPILTVKNGKKTLRITAFQSVGYLNKEKFDLGSVAVYIDVNDTFYIPQSLAEKMK